MQNYFIHPILGKIVLIRENNEEKWYKEINNNLIPLSPKEQKVIDKIFKGKSKTLMYSKTLDNIIAANPNLIPYNSDIFKLMIETIENLIPENYRQDFYNNLKSLEIEYGIEYVSLSDKKENKKLLGGYSVSKNKIVIYKHTLERKMEFASHTPNPQETYNKEINKIFIHELLHMASSYVDKENEIYWSGFGNAADVDNDYESLTEGFTELISMTLVPGTNEMSSFYYIETLLSTQLTLVVGLDTMKDSYFGRLGITKIEQKLNEIDSIYSMSLLKNIEYSYLIRSELGDTPNTFLGISQNTLIHLFEQKLLKDIENGMSKEEIMSTINTFEQMLITPEILKTIGLNPDNYKGIDISKYAFNNTKEYILNMLEEKIENNI